MTTPPAQPAAATPTKAPCWPPGWLDGATEIFLPSEKYLKAHWDADILDIDDQNIHDTIIERKDTFKVRFRVELKGRLWTCICGHWCFDVCFTAVGDGPNFDLSDVLPDRAVLQVPDWMGCQTTCVELCVTVPPETIPIERCGVLYEIGAKFELRCCGGCEDANSHLAVAGHESEGQYMFV
jgi:hypothetical protein